MRLGVELTGPVRISSGKQYVTIEVPAGATGKDVLQALAQAEPRLLGSAIAPGCERLMWPYLLDIDTRRKVRDFHTPLELTPDSNLALLTIPC